MKYMKRLNRIISNNFLMLKYAFKLIPSYVVYKIFMSIFQGVVTNLVDILFVKKLYETIEAQFASGNTNFTELGKLFLIMFGFHLFNIFIWLWHLRYFKPMTDNRLRNRMQNLIYEKTLKIEISCYEDPEFYNNFIWAMQQSNGQVMNAMNTFMELFKTFLGVFSIGSIIITMDWIVAPFIIIGVVLPLLTRYIKATINLKRDENLNPVNRKISYIGRILYLEQFAKEIRLNKIKDLLYKKYDKSVDEQKKITLDNIKKIFFIDFFSSTIHNIVMNVIFLLVLIYRVVVSGTLSIGGMLVLQQGTASISSNFRGFLFSINAFRENSLYIEKFRQFMDYEPFIKDQEKSLPLKRPFQSLELDDVSFSYNSKPEHMVLKHINIQINKNEKVAIVGYNGAGKSTLIKLILRLYEQNSGVIKINGEDIRNFTLETYRSKFSTIFQDFKLFSVSLAENVIMNRCEHTKEEQQTVTDALRMSTFGNKLNNLPKGIDTTITREFDNDGTILSGGEMQKVAIARIFAANSDFVIMDEPSSALDPISEYELNELMMNSSYHKTVIFISHRLATTRMADKIYMLDDGEIIEQGNHVELMKLNGKYAEMFRMQAEKYLIK